MPRTKSPPEPTNEDPWFKKYFPDVVRWSGLGIALYLIITGKVSPQVALAFAGTMISGTLLAQELFGRRDQ